MSKLREKNNREWKRGRKTEHKRERDWKAYQEKLKREEKLDDKEMEKGNAQICVWEREWER